MQLHFGNLSLILYKKEKNQMSGMLPGVEAARRRRFHQNSTEYNPTATNFGSTRHSSFCLNQRNEMSMYVVECDDSRLCAAAREAKKRLDKRLQQSWRSQIKRELIEIA